MTTYSLEFDKPLQMSEAEKLRELIRTLGTGSGEGCVWYLTADYDYETIRTLLFERLGFCPLISRRFAV